MKTMIYNICVIYILSICMACMGDQKEGTDKDIIIAIDYTDSLLLYPKTDDVLKLTGLDNNPWQGIKLEITGISDKDMNQAKSFYLPSQMRLTGNKQQRAAQVEKFSKEIGLYLNQVRYTKELNHSIIYRSLAQCLNKLTLDKSKQKQLIVYSNLMENSDVNFYDTATFHQIQSDYLKVKHRIEIGSSLQNVAGIQTWLLYNPTSFEDNATFRITSNFFKQILEEKGVKVQIGIDVNQ